MCRALKVLCAAPTVQALSELKRACVAATWELVGGATTTEELVAQLDEWEPDVLVVDAGLGEEAVRAVRATRPSIRIVGLGPVPGADEKSASLDGIRSSILGLPRPGGPVGV
jgi:DNA-binding NarL/FixJ family response regulator